MRVLSLKDSSSKPLRLPTCQRRYKWMRLLWLAVDNTLAQLFYSHGYARIFTEKSRSSIVAEYVQLAMSHAYMQHVQCIIYLPSNAYRLGSKSLSNAGQWSHLQQTQTTLQAATSLLCNSRPTKCFDMPHISTVKLINVILFWHRANARPSQRRLWRD